MTDIDTDDTKRYSSLFSIPTLGPQSLKRADLRDITYSLLTFCVHDSSELGKSSTLLSRNGINFKIDSDFSDLIQVFSDKISHLLKRDEDVVYLFEYDSLHTIHKILNNLPVSVKTWLNKAIQSWYEENKQNQGMNFPTIPIQLSDRFFACDTKKEQSHCTPYELNALMAGLLVLHGDMCIYDPACGTGGSLLVCAQHVRDAEEGKMLSIYGHEIDMRTCSYARKNAYLQDIHDSNIIHNDAILTPFSYENGELIHFDRCLCEIPRSVDISQWDMGNLDNDPRFSSQSYRVRRSEIFFMKHMMHLLKPEGKMAVIVPHDLLYSGGRERIFRENLFKNHHVIAVIYLPENILFSSDEASALLLIENKKPDTLENTLFVDISQHIVRKYGRNSISPETIELVCSVIHKKLEIKGFSSSVSLDSIAEEEYRLTVSRYVDSLATETLINVRSVLLDLQTLESHRKNTSQKTEEYLKKIGFTS